MATLFVCIGVYKDQHAETSSKRAHVFFSRTRSTLPVGRLFQHRSATVLVTMRRWLTLHLLLLRMFAHDAIYASVGCFVWWQWRLFATDSFCFHHPEQTLSDVMVKTAIVYGCKTYEIQKAIRINNYDSSTPIITNARPLNLLHLC